MVLCFAGIVSAQQTARVDLPGIPRAEIRTISPVDGYPRLEVRDGNDHLLRALIFRVWRNIPGYIMGPAQTRFRVLDGPTIDTKIILSASGSGRADHCNVSVALLGVRNGVVKPLMQKPFAGDYPVSHFYWGELGNGWGYGLAHWEHARGNRFDDHIRLTLYRYDPLRNELVKSKVMTTREVIRFDSPNPLMEFGVQYANVLDGFFQSC
jgi:hypothetical protein